MPQMDGPSIIGMAAAATSLIERGVLTWNEFAACRLRDDQVPRLGLAINTLHDAHGILPRFAATKPNGVPNDLWINPDEIQTYAQSWSGEAIRASQNFAGATYLDKGQSPPLRLITGPETAEKHPLSLIDPRIQRALGCIWRIADASLTVPEMVKEARLHKRDLAIIWHSDAEYDDKLDASTYRSELTNQTVYRHVLFELLRARRGIGNLSGYEPKMHQLTTLTRLVFSIQPPNYL